MQEHILAKLSEDYENARTDGTICLLFLHWLCFFTCPRLTVTLIDIDCNCDLETEYGDDFLKENPNHIQRVLQVEDHSGTEEDDA